MNFFIGFATGFFFKEKLVPFIIHKCTYVCTKVCTKVCTNVCTENNFNKQYFVCKITNNYVFNQLFPVLETKYRTQPTWEYNKHKNTIKIELEPFSLNCSFKDFLDNIELDVPLFESFGDISLYVHYTSNLKEYINVYTKGTVIQPSDFIVTETDLSKRHEKIICVTVLTGETHVYITNYFKKFLNNRYPLKSDTILLYCDQLEELNDISMQVVNINNIKLYSLNQTI